MRKRFFHYSSGEFHKYRHIVSSSGKFIHHSQEENALGAVKTTDHSSKIYLSEWWVVKKTSFFVFTRTLY